MRKRFLRALIFPVLFLLLTCAVPTVRAASARSFPETAFVYPIYSVRTEVNGVRHQIQGACTDGRYIWGGWNKRRIITRLDITTGELQTREFTEEEWVCGHINDMTYNPNTNLLYVVSYDPDDFSTRGNIVMLDPITLEYRGVIRLRHDEEMIPINSLTYDRLHDRYIVSLTGDAGKNYVLLDSDFRYVGALVLEREEVFTLQGIETDGKYLYRSLWGKNSSNYITVYDMDGRFLAQIDIGISGSDMELEDIMYDWNGAWYLNCAHRDGTGGSFFYTQLVPDEDHSLWENILGRIAAPISDVL